MLLDWLLLILGLGILVAGGEILVRGASSLARSVGVSPLAIGLTVVAFGTSAPELAVNVGAAMSDSGALSFGNIFGSNMANIGLIVGLVAILSPLSIDSIVIRRELPMMLLATAAAAVLAFDTALADRKSFYERGDGLILLLFFVVFLYYTVGDLIRQRNGHVDRESTGTLAAAALEDMAEEEEQGYESHVIRDLSLSVLGLAGLIGGSELTVDAAVGLARTFEVPEVLIGLTLVSVGTSLPELATGLIAIRHGRSDLAVGSVVGSNIFNTLLVCGITAVVSPMEIPPGGYADLAATALLSLFLTLCASTHLRRIVRIEGVGLLCGYLGYMVWRTISLG